MSPKEPHTGVTFLDFFGAELVESGQEKQNLIDSPKNHWNLQDLSCLELTPNDGFKISLSGN